MLRSLCQATRLQRAALVFQPSTTTAVRSLSTVPLDDRAFHHLKPRYTDYTKFKSPRKRASKLLHELNTEAVTLSKARNPELWETDIKVGDAIEFVVVDGVKSDKTEKIRGVVLGKYNRGLDTSVLIRDVVMGQTVERRMPLHSPLIRSVQVLEENFIYKGKRKVKRAKLYYLRDRNPLCKWFVRCCWWWSIGFRSHIRFYSDQGLEVLVRFITSRLKRRVSNSSSCC